MLVALTLSLTLSLTLLTASVDANATCSPSSSKPDIRVKLVGDTSTTCYFPFKAKDEYYFDCKNEGGMYWCATTCNFQRDRKWQYCRYSVSQLGMTNCQDLPRTAPSAEPQTSIARGAKHKYGVCHFPFLSHGRCYSDCMITRYGSRVCPTTKHMAMGYNTYRVCNYMLRDKAPDYCHQLSSSRKHYAVRFSEKYSAPAGTDPDGNCTFPFSYQGRCYDDCVPRAEDDFKIWCSTDMNYATSRWRYCPHYRKYKEITHMALRWGYYRIRFSSSNCGNNLAAFCNAAVVPGGGVGSQRLALSRSESQIWEILPQPNNFFIVRSAFDCRSVPLAWSLENGKPSVESLSKDREFWGIDAVPGSAGGEFRIRASDSAVRERFLRPKLSGSNAVLGLWYENFEHTSFRIEKISDSEIAQQQSACEQLNAETTEAPKTTEGFRTTEAPKTTEGFRRTEAPKTTEGFRRTKAPKGLKMTEESRETEVAYLLTPAPNVNSGSASVTMSVVVCMASVAVAAAAAVVA